MKEWPRLAVLKCNCWEVIEPKRRQRPRRTITVYSADSGFSLYAIQDKVSNEKWITYDKNARKRSRPRGKQASHTIAKPQLTRNKLCMCMVALEEHYSLLAFTAGQNHHFGFVLPRADETQAKSGVKTAGIDQQ
ncbi:hypothetical protein EVAR_75450_1 [Eumeta japonica]|uniref:Uncharacterized protein n=1 Tax=Eumeta variegata TaxID=151549 RepID=A0A4C1TKY7_EUMVA|nr:hypothetical protein EVAR_75450_1 [Eumeta japonica]